MAVYDKIADTYIEKTKSVSDLFPSPKMPKTLFNAPEKPSFPFSDYTRQIETPRLPTSLSNVPSLVAEKPNYWEKWGMIASRIGDTWKDLITGDFNPAEIQHFGGALLGTAFYPIGEVGKWWTPGLMYLKAKASVMAGGGDQADKDFVAKWDEIEKRGGLFSDIKGLFSDELQEAAQEYIGTTHGAERVGVTLAEFLNPTYYPLMATGGVGGALGMTGQVASKIPLAGRVLAPALGKVGKVVGAGERVAFYPVTLAIKGAVKGVERITRPPVPLTRQPLPVGYNIKPSEGMAPSTSVQVGLPGIGKVAAQSKLLEEAATAPGMGGVKPGLVDVEALKAAQAARPLPGQIEMPKVPAAPAKRIPTPVTDGARVAQINARLAKIDRLIATEGRLPKGEGTKAELAIEKARLVVQKDLISIETLEQLESAISEVEAELGIRSIPYHGGAKAGPWAGWTSKQLDEVLRVYEEARSEIIQKQYSELAIPKPVEVKPVSPEIAMPIEFQREQIARGQVELDALPPSKPNSIIATRNGFIGTDADGKAALVIQVTQEEGGKLVAGNVVAREGLSKIVVGRLLKKAEPILREGGITVPTEGLSPQGARIAGKYVAPVTPEVAIPKAEVLPAIPKLPAKVEAPVPPPKATVAEGLNARAVLDESYNKRLIDKETYDTGRELLKIDNTFDANTTLKISNQVKMATEEIKSAGGITERGDFIVTGETITAYKNDILSTAIKLYKGADKTTIVEEWYHRYFNYLNPKTRKMVEDYYIRKGKVLPVAEQFAKDGMECYFGRKPRPVGILNRIFDKIDTFLDILSNRVTGGSIRRMYQQAGTRGVSGLRAAPEMLAGAQLRRLQPGMLGGELAAATAREIPTTTPAAQKALVTGRVPEYTLNLQKITPGLTEGEIRGNVAKRISNKAVRKLGAKGFIEYDPVANAAMNERARLKLDNSSQAAVAGPKVEEMVQRAFVRDKNGGITKLAGIDPSIPGAPTIQDVAARRPIYEPHLTPAQRNVLDEINNIISPRSNQMRELGIEFGYRSDVMEGGFYIPRGGSGLEGFDAPIKIGTGLGRGGKISAEKPAVFSSMAEGISKGYVYEPLITSISGYVRGSGGRIIDTHIANYFKTVTDETGKLIGETPKMRLIRQNPELAEKMEALKSELNRLKRLKGSLSDRQQKVIDLWQNDPEFDDLATLLDGLSTMKTGTKPGMTQKELIAQLELTKNAIRDLQPEYAAAKRRATLTPREEGQIGLARMQGWTFPDEIANSVNIILKKEGETVGGLASAVNITDSLNNFYRNVNLTLDNSALGIQAVLSFFAEPKLIPRVLKVNFRAWGINGDRVLGKYLISFDKREGLAGRLTAADWVKEGAHIDPLTFEAITGMQRGVGGAITKLPGFRQANRAFGYTGVADRLEMCSIALENEMKGSLFKRGKTLAQIKTEGGLAQIAREANMATGWTPSRAGGSLGQLVLLAPRWFQSRLETVVAGARGMLPGATLSQQLARKHLLKMIGMGTLITVGANELLGNETDFRPIVDGKRNPHFMKIYWQGRYYSVFGPWDSLVGMMINVGTGEPLRAVRSMGSGVTTFAFDLITGRDYDYNPTRDNPANFVKWLGKSFLPIAAEQLPESIGQAVEGVQMGNVGQAASGIVGGVSELLGVKSWSETQGAEPYKESDFRPGLMPPELIPTPGQSQSRTRWQAVRPQLNSLMLRGLSRVWYYGGTLTPEEETALKKVFNRYPFGQDNFNTWLKMTLRQIYETAISETR